MRGAQAVRADPLQQFEVAQHHRVVVLLADDRVVLVHAEAGQVDRLTVEQQLAVGGLDGAHSDQQVVVVHQVATVEHLDVQVVAVGVPGAPGLHVGDLQASGRAVAMRHLGAGGVAQRDANLALLTFAARHLDLVVDQAGAAVEPGDHRDVVDPQGRPVEQPDMAVDTGVVEEVMPVGEPRPRRGLLDPAGRDGLEGELVVGDDGQGEPAAGPDMLGDVDLEGQVAAVVFGDLVVVHEDGCGVGHRFEIEDDLLGPAVGYLHPPLVPNIAEELPFFDGGVDVVPRAGDGHLAGLGDPSLPLGSTALAFGIKGEIPKSVEVAGISAGCILGAKHSRELLVQKWGRDGAWPAPNGTGFKRSG